MEQHDDKTTRPCGEGGGKEDILSLPKAALALRLKAAGQPGYRAAQLFRWLHQRGAQSFDEMTDLGKALRGELAARYRIGRAEVVAEAHAADGTAKALVRLWDGQCVESVRMRHRHGVSLCLSTQVGCRMGCRFCASTKGGLVRNLDAGEMAAQLYAAAAAQRAEQGEGARITHLVLMGVGEPLDNYDAVLDFLSIATDADGMDLSMRNVTLSTCGLVPAIDRLAKEGLGLTLSVSLHAPNDAKRSALMPVNDAFGIAPLLAAAQRYQRATGRRVSYEYALAKGHNDSPGDAAQLAALLAGSKGHLNLIPLNPVDGSAYTRSDEEAVRRFAEEMNRRGVNTTVRRRLGSDIDAACGQLRARVMDKDSSVHTG